MHPAIMYWWKNARHHGGGACGAWAGCGSSGEGRDHGGEEGHYAGGEGGDYGDAGGGAFGVRRPLRFLAHKLQLDEPQVAELAKILNELKTERAQADVDGRRTVSAFADAVSGAAFDDAKAAEGAVLRVKAAERLRDAVVKSLGRIHALLTPEQRNRLAYLIRTGVVSI